MQPQRCKNKNLKDLYKSYLDKRGRLAATMIPVQKQNDCNSYGLFTIAFAADILSGDSPANSKLDLSQTRSHLLICLENGDLKKFPRNPKQKRSSVKSQEYKVVLV